MKNMMKTTGLFLGTLLALSSCAHNDDAYLDSNRPIANSDQVDPNRVSLFEGNEIGDSYDSNRVGGDDTVDSPRMASSYSRESMHSRHLRHENTGASSDPSFHARMERHTVHPDANRVTAMDLAGMTTNSQDRALTSSGAIQKRMENPGSSSDYTTTTGASSEEHAADHASEPATSTADNDVKPSDMAGGEGKMEKALPHSGSIEKKAHHPGKKMVKRNKKKTTTGAVYHRRSTTTGASTAGKMHHANVMTEQNNALNKEMALNHLYHVNMKEIAFADLAKKKSDNQAVLSHADKIKADHEALNEKVKATADSEGVKLHDYQLATYEAATYDRLNSLSGTDFDQAYFQVMKQGHETAMTDVKKEQTLVRDPEVSALLRGALPSFRQHEQMTTTGASRAR